MAAADAHHIGPAQLLTKVKIPTATTLKVSTPLYALERSTEEMALDPPNAKNDAYWRTRVVIASSVVDNSKELSMLRRSSKIRKRGMLVTRDCVISASVSRSWKTLVLSR